MKSSKKNEIVVKILNYFKNKLMCGNNDCVRLEFINNKLNKETETLRFDLLIINNSTNQIRLERLYLKIGQEVKPVYILATPPTNNPNEEQLKWIPFDNTYLMNKILYSVNSPGSWRIEEVGIFDNYVGMKNVATPIPKCKVEHIKDVNEVEIVLEYLITNSENREIAKVTKHLAL